MTRGRLRSPGDDGVPPQPADSRSSAEPGDGLPPVDVLAAERAGSAYWRDVARQRRLDAARVQRRPIVRAAVALDRRSRHLQDALGRSTVRGRAITRQVAVLGPGLLQRVSTRRRSPDRRRSVERTSLAGPPTTGQPGQPAGSPEVPALDATLVLCVVDGAGTGALRGPDGETNHAIDVPFGEDCAERIDDLVEGSTARHIALLGPTVHGDADGAWLPALAGVIADRVVAATPRTVHPRRLWWAATAHDQLVRADGLDVQVEDGTPTMVARNAGGRPDGPADPHDVVAGTGALLVDRRAWLAAGGLTTSHVRNDWDTVDPTTRFDGLLIDLCLRLRRAGGRVMAVPAAVLIDDRPVHDRASLHVPIDPTGPVWRSLVERHGPELAHATASDAPGERRPTVALTTAAPSLKMAPRSGDWHFAQDLAGALRRRAFDVRLQTAEEADALAGRSCDLHLVLRGLEPVARTAGQRHVLWIISHPEALELAECDEADLVLVASERFAAHLATRTSTPVAVLHQATEPRRFRPMSPITAHAHHLTVVANAREGDRASVIDALAAGLRPTIYGQGWEDRVDPTLIAAPYVGAADLPGVYASADVVLNDHWATMRHWGFVSNRIFDVLACATPVVSDHLPEIDQLFGNLVPTWRDPDELREIVDGLLGDADAAAALGNEGRQRVLGAHTFDHRAAELAALLEHHGLLGGGEQ